MRCSLWFPNGCPIAIAFIHFSTDGSFAGYPVYSSGHYFTEFLSGLEKICYRSWTVLSADIFAIVNCNRAIEMYSFTTLLIRTNQWYSSYAWCVFTRIVGLIILRVRALYWFKYVLTVYYNVK